MKTVKELESELRIQEREFLIKLAHAKALFEDLSFIFETCKPVLCGKRRGHKSCETLVEKSLFRGKSFFNGVKCMKDLAADVNSVE